MAPQRPPEPPIEPPPAPLSDGLPRPPGSRARAEVPPPPPPPAKRFSLKVVAVLTALFVVGAAGGFGVASLLQGGPCDDATFVSVAYGYCVTVPAGWEPSHAAEEPSGVDAFRDTDAPTVVYIEAIRLPEGDGLQEFAKAMRVQDSLNGFAVTDPEPGTLGEARSLEWDARGPFAGDDVVVREIVAIRGGIGWRLQIAGADVGGEPDLAEARVMLDSWAFA